MIGETVIAIGNAFGYEHTASVGVVSATKRDVSVNRYMPYKSLIQIDACINPGNSGGPLINIHGELVGVNVAIRADAQGIGFAIPVDHMVKSVAAMLKKRRLTYSAYDGFAYRDLLQTPTTASSAPWSSIASIRPVLPTRLGCATAMWSFGWATSRSSPASTSSAA
jgi:serine protease Do